MGAVLCRFEMLILCLRDMTSSQGNDLLMHGRPVVSSQFSSSKLSLWIAGDFSDASPLTASYLASKQDVKLIYYKYISCLDRSLSFCGFAHK